MPTKLKKSADGRLFVVHDCPHCGTNMRHKVEEIGLAAHCRSCSGHLTIPGHDLYQAYLRTLEPAPEPPSAPVLQLGLEDEVDTLPPSRAARPAAPSRPRSSETRLTTLDDERETRRRRDRFDEDDDDYLSMTAIDGETVRLRFGPATAAVVGLQVLVGLGVMIWLLILVGVILTGRRDFVDRPGTALGGTFIMAVYGFCVLVLPSLIALLRVWKRKYFVTDRRIVSQSGLASLNVHEVRNGAVSGLTVRQSFFGRLLGFGTVHIFADGTNLRILWVDHPVAIAAAVRSVIEADKP